MKLRSDDPIVRFVLRLALWLPPCFALWYWLAGLWLPPLALLVDGVLQVTMVDAFRELAIEGRAIAFDTRLVVRAEDGRSGSPMFALNPLSYAWNLPVLFALLLAGATKPRLSQRLLLGYLLLLPAWIWGLCFQFAKTLTFDLGTDVAEQLGEPGLWIELVALGYQFGVLVLPATALVLVWLLLGRDDLLLLAGMRAAPRSDARGPAPARPRRQPRKRRKARRRASAMR